MPHEEGRDQRQQNVRTRRLLQTVPCAISGYKKVTEPTQDVLDLKFLIDQWREPEMVSVRSDLVVPDSSNRMHTGLSVDHVHYLATCMMKDGFRGRKRGPLNSQPCWPKQPHDIPVLVRGSPRSQIANDSLEHFSSQVAAQKFFPRVTIKAEGPEWFCSLGNGHFTQALNCFRQNVSSIFTGRPFAPPPEDDDLNEALRFGIDTVVLREETPVETRREISKLLNDTHDYKWTVDAKGEIDVTAASCSLHRYTNFEALSKGLDNEALTQLVRLELGVAKEMDERYDAELAAKREAAKRTPGPAWLPSKL